MNKLKRRISALLSAVLCFSFMLQPVTVAAQDIEPNANQSSVLSENFNEVAANAKEAAQRYAEENGIAVPQDSETAEFSLERMLKASAYNPVSIYLSSTQNISYNSYSTRDYTLSDGTMAFCLEPSASSPADGTYTAYENNDLLMRAILYYGYGGPGYNDPNFGMVNMLDGGNQSGNVPYIVTHLALSWVFDGCSEDSDAFKGVTASLADGVREIVNAISGYSWMVESVAPNYRAFVFETGADTQRMGAGVFANPTTGYLTLTKTSANPALTDGNSCYSLTGAEFGVYTELECTNQIATLITDASGNANTVEVGEGTYYVKETKAPKGFTLSNDVIPVTVTSGQTATVSFTDLPQSDPVRVVLGKSDKETNKNKPQGSASLAGAEFTVKYYNGFYDTDPALQGQTAVRTWVLRTNENGLALFNSSYKVSGDDFYYNGTSIPTLPLGTVTIQETKAPEGYLINSEVFVRQVTSDSDIEAVNTYNQPIIPEQTIRGGVKIAKMDSEKGKSEAQGEGELGKAEFSIVTLNENTVMVDGVEYSKGQVVKTIVTDSVTNIATTKADTLPYGDYKIYESKSPTGYLPNPVEREFSIRENGKIVDLTGKADAVPDDVIRGGVKIAKMDSEKNKSEAQGAATLKGTQFAITSKNKNTVLVDGKEYSNGKVVKTITSNASGIAATAADSLPYGDYTIKEIKAPSGYLLTDGSEHAFSITQDGVIVDLTGTDNAIKDGVIRGGVEIQKRDIETGADTPLGSATLEGAVIEIISLNENSVLVDSGGDGNSEEYSKNQTVMTLTTDENGHVATASDALPYGTYKAVETKSPDGYLLSGVTERTFTITKDGVVVKLTDEDNAILDQVKRGDFDLTKIDSSTQNAMAGVKFKITSNTTGESHTFTTDENGYYSSSSSWNKHSQNTNGGGAEDGLWFGMDTEGNKAEVDDSLGALPKDTYTIEELPCEANEGKRLYTGILVISRDNVTIHMNNIENTGISIGTSAKSEDTNSHYAFAQDGAVIIDTVTMSGLETGAGYTLVGTLMDKETGKALVNSAGNEISSRVIFTATAEIALKDMEFIFDASDLAGHDIVVYERLYHDGAKVAEHTDLMDEDQTIHFPEIGTKAADENTGIDVSLADEKVTLTDTVSYSNLQIGRIYTVTGILMDKETGEEALDADGNTITAKTSFVAVKSSGEIELTFTFNGTEFAGKSVVAFETLSRNDKEYAVHADIEDEDQTVHFPEIRTTVKDSDTGEHASYADKKITLVDTVSYKNLKPGYSYVLKGTLMDKETGKALKVNGNTVTAQTTFTPNSYSGTAKVTFAFDGTGLEGKTLVVYEELCYGSEVVAEHKELTDEGQTIHIPEIGTSVSDSDTGINVSYAKEEVTVMDTVSYENLIPGKEYKLTGILMDKETGKELLDKEGNQITAETTFTPEDYSGTVEVTFTFPGTGLAGTTAVAFETLSRNDKVYAVHADITDEAQTLYIPKIGTTAKDSDTQENASFADDEITLTDTVSYTDLKPDCSYTIKGIVYDKETGKPLEVDGKKVTAEAELMPEESGGTIDLTFTFDGTGLEGKTLVVFETVYYEKEIVAKHADLQDEGQTIHIPKIGTSVSDNDTEINVSYADSEVIVTDTVSYQNLIPGKEYKLSGILMDKETGEELLNKEGNQITAETVFTPEDYNGTVEVTFTFLGTGLAGTTAVAFETLSRNDKVYAVHADIEDEAQTLYIPKIGTTAKDSDTEENASYADGEITLVDTVSYTDLKPGCSYTVKGIIYDKETRKPLRVEGKMVTAQAELVPEESSGSIDLTFTFDGTDMEGKALVVFERVFYGKKIVAKHTDIDDEGQTIHIPKIGTSLSDSDTGINVSYADEEVTLTDTVSYENLVPGKEYKLTGTLMDKKTGEAVLDKNGEAVRAETVFTPEDYSGTAEVTFIFNGENLAGTTAVAFETLTRNDKVYAVHADIEDEAQTVTFPKIGTTVKDMETQEHTSFADEEITLVDTVSYENLDTGYAYTVKGILYDKETREPLEVDGKKVTAEAELVPEESSGTIDLTFTFDGTDLAGKTLVVFETVYYEEEIVAEHADLEDEGQTIYIPEIGTTALDAATGTNTGTAGEQTKLVDTVTYTNLIPGKEYTVKGILMDKSTGEPFHDAQGNTVTAETTFTPEENSGTVEVVFEFTSKAGDVVVAFEELYYNGVLVAAHTDIEDEAQTVQYVAPEEPKTGDYSPVGAMAATVAGAGAVLAGLAYAKKKRKTEEK